MSQKISISTTTLILGLIIAIIASGIVSSVATQQLTPSVITGPQGPQGEQGLIGPQGEPGDPASSKYIGGYGGMPGDRINIPTTPISLASHLVNAPVQGLILLRATATVTIHGDSTACTFG